MSQHFEQLLINARKDPTLWTEIYSAFSEENFWVLVDPSDLRLEFLKFLSYPSTDGVHEIPLFLSLEDPGLIRLIEQTSAEAMHIDSPNILKVAQDIVETGKIELAVIFGEYGFRINRNILLSIAAVSPYLRLQSNNSK